MRLIIFLVLIALCAGPAHAQTYTVRKIIDADTFELTTGVTVHMIGVQAVEEQESEYPSEESITDRWINNIVENYLLTPGVEVFLQYDVEKRDSSGTILAYVYRKRPLDENDFERKGCWISALINGEEYLFINEYIVCSGAAAAVSEPPNLKYAERFQILYDNALKYKTGY